MTPDKLSVVYIQATGHVVGAAIRAGTPDGLVPTSGGLVRRVFDGAVAYELAIASDYLASRSVDYRPNGDRVLLREGGYELNDADGTVEPLPAAPTVSLGAGTVTVATGDATPRKAFVLLSTEQDPVIADVANTQDLAYGSLAAGDKAGVLVLVEGMGFVAEVKTAS